MAPQVAVILGICHHSVKNTVMEGSEFRCLYVELEDSPELCLKPWFPEDDDGCFPGMGLGLSSANSIGFLHGWLKGQT